MLFNTEKKISTVCENIIENVKYNVENLTGLTVKKVNVNVHGIKLEDN
ncbi:Asp23/Gls24 family envelope stress response protein [Parvimonas sp. G1425]